MAIIHFQFFIFNLGITLLPYSLASDYLDEASTKNVNSGEIVPHFVNSKNYVLHFYSIPLTYIFESKVLQYAGKTSLSEYSWLIIQKHEPNLDTTCKTYSCSEISDVMKYHQPTSIVFTTLPKNYNDMVISSSIIMYPTTIIIFISFETNVNLKSSANSWLQVMLSPSLKLLLLASEVTGKTIYIRFICNGYCTHNFQTLAMQRKDLLNIFQDPKLFQKNHFWNAQGKKSVAMAIPTTIGYFNKSIVKNRDSCNKYVNGRTARFALFCSSIIMIPLTLGSTHNVSFQMYHTVK